jgi:penicillin-insensitive murein endopeptidase
LNAAARTLCVVALAAVSAAAAARPLPSNGWSAIERPTAGAPAAIGGFADGCLAGGVPLPADGPGYALVRPSRRRYFGHPDLVDFVEQLGRRARGAGLPVFYVGDMAQPRGGPLPFGHASHQTGLDVDIWFTAETKPRPSPAEREAPALPSMLLPGGRGVDPARFGARQVSLLRLAASDPHVDRIFVNPMIKLALCRGYGNATENGGGWLGRLRPWWGHDDHFHVRLACPAGSPLCVPQPPVPPGDGCDASLEDWPRHPNPPGPAASLTPRRILPTACHGILQQGL